MQTKKKDEDTSENSHRNVQVKKRTEKSKDDGEIKILKRKRGRKDNNAGSNLNKKLAKSQVSY